MSGSRPESENLPGQIFLDIDRSLLELDETEAAFFKSQTGIQADEELKEHICDIQSKAYKVSISY